MCPDIVCIQNVSNGDVFDIIQKRTEFSRMNLMCFDDTSEFDTSHYKKNSKLYKKLVCTHLNHSKFDFRVNLKINKSSIYKKFIKDD